MRSTKHTLTTLAAAIVAAAAVPSAIADRPTGYTLTALPKTQQVQRGDQVEIELTGFNGTATDSDFCLIDVTLNGAAFGSFYYYSIPSGQSGGTTDSFWNTDDSSPKVEKLDFELTCGGVVEAGARATVVVKG